MLTEERHSQILAILQQQEIVTSQNLVQQLSVSESTIRRDLQELEKAEKLIRIHGGAKRLVKLEQEFSLKEKDSQNKLAKQKIATTASQFVRENDYIFLDAGSTTLAMIPKLIQPGIKVVTNSVVHANYLLDQGVSVIMLGGLIRSMTKAAVSSFALKQLENLYFDKAFIGANGVDVMAGYTTADGDEALIKKIAIKQAQKSYILADFSKINKINLFKISNLSQAELITNQLTEQNQQQLLAQTTIWEVES